MVMDRDLTWSGEHTVQCTDDILWNHAPETYIILLTSGTPINSIKRQKSTEEEVTLFNSFYEVSFILISKLNRNITGKLQNNLSYKYGHKNLQQNTLKPNPATDEKDYTP